jgi:hypothetical protein
MFLRTVTFRHLGPLSSASRQGLPEHFGQGKNRQHKGLQEREQSERGKSAYLFVAPSSLWSQGAPVSGHDNFVKKS